MGIRVYNTLSREKEDFVTVEPGKVGIYLCGPTVYAPSHIGHMVGPVIFDTIKRYLQYSGYEVTFVINITDVDDKIIQRAAQEGCSTEELAARITSDYLENLEALRVSVDHFPKATAFIPHMIRMIGGLVTKGYAYPAGGDVYFDVRRDEDYGKLSNRKLDEMFAGVRKEVNDAKRHPGDFALWKGAKPGEPAWESPWGPGRPGWHIECSAMSLELLGETFDIHGGGLDLCFPHHEDEIAQSESYSGKPFARYWMHNGLMQRSDEAHKLGATRDSAREGDFASQEQGKISKSKGASAVKGLFEQYSPETIRFFLLSTHYRRPIDYSEDRLTEVGRGLARLHAFAERFERVFGQPFHTLEAPTRRAEPPASDTDFQQQVNALRQRFLASMDDDFNTGGAIGVLFELLPVLNRFADAHGLEQPNSDPATRDEWMRGAVVLKELTRILGILETPVAKAEAADDLVSPLMELLLEVRQQARGAKNFAMADHIRKRLAELQIVIEDGPQGSRWKRG